MKQKKNLDILFYIPLLIILTISIFVMYHARIISPLYSKNAIKQAIFFLIGSLILLFKNKIKRKWLLNSSFFIYLFSCILLILVLFFGSNINGAKAWFKFKYFNFQPSEFMKIAMSLYLTKLTLSHSFQTKKNEISYLLKVFMIFIIPSILVFLEPDTGAIIFYALITSATILTSKISKKWLIPIILLILGFIGLFFYAYYFQRDILISFIGTSFFYRIERLLNFQKGLQIENALTALGSAPLIRFNLHTPIIYIPEAPTDFAFALTANVFGILGNIILLISYFLLDIYLLKVWITKKETKQKIFISSFLTIFFFNQFYNIIMNIGLLPIMGIPLPLFSYGGSTTLITFLFLAIITQKI